MTVWNPVSSASSAAADWLQAYQMTRVFSTTRHEPRRRRRPAPMGASVRHVNGSEAYAWGDASEPSVLLVHGWGSDCAAMVPFVRPLRRSGFRAVTFDAPAHGSSAATKTTLRAFTDRVRQALRAEGGVTAVIAHSLGGLAAVAALAEEAALGHSGTPRFAALVLISSPCDLSETLTKFWDAHQMRPGARRLMLQRLQHLNGVPFEYWNAACLARRVEVPNVLIIHDQMDERISVGESRRLRAAFDARVHLTSGLGHSAILFNGGVPDFVAKFVQSAACEAAPTSLSHHEDLLHAR